jgi:hypothetical protein
MAKTKKIKVIVLKDITDFDGKRWSPSSDFQGLELSVKDYKHFEEHNAVKAYVDLSEYDEDE